MTNLMKTVKLAAWKGDKWLVWHALEDGKARCGYQPEPLAAYVETVQPLPGIIAEYLDSMCRECCDALRQDLVTDAARDSGGFNPLEYEGGL